MNDSLVLTRNDAASAWRSLADWTVDRDWQPSARAEARALDALIDTVACFVAGVVTPAYERVAHTAVGWGAGPATAVWAGKLSTPAAALVNGTVAHALDFDDHDDPTLAHPSAVLFPAVLALGESTDADGRAVLRAYIAGLEVMDRLGELLNPWHYERGWHATSTLGSIAAAAAGACLLRLSPDRALAALSLGSTMAGGLKAQFGSEAKPLHAGLAAQHGVMAAELAANGLTAASDGLSGPLGFTGIYGRVDGSVGGEAPALPPPLAIEQHGLSVKKYPCCSYLGRILDSLLALRGAGRLAADSIARMEVTVPKRSAAVVRFQMPTNLDEARFSVPWCAAVAICEGSLRARHFTPEALAQPNWRALAERIVMIPSERPQPLADFTPEDPDEIAIDFTDGGRLEVAARVVRGGPSDPLSRDELLEKLRNCSEGLLSPERLAALEAELVGFADGGDATALMALLERKG